LILELLCNEQGRNRRAVLCAGWKHEVLGTHIGSLPGDCSYDLASESEGRELGRFCTESGVSGVKNGVFVA